MSEDEIKINALKIHRNPKPNKGGSVIIAEFDCVARGIVMRRCALARTIRHGITVWPPKMIETSDPTLLLVRIADNKLRADIIRAARGVYQAMGGEFADFIPVSDEATRHATAAQVAAAAEAPDDEEPDELPAFLKTPTPLPAGDHDHG